MVADVPGSAHSYAVLGEAPSDVETIAVFIRRLSGNPRTSIRKKGLGGGPKLRKHGARELRTCRDLGCTRFVVCHDADGPDPEPRKNAIIEEVIRPAEIVGAGCVLVPVHEIEAWILADIVKVTNVMSSWRPAPFTSNPEAVEDPKRELKRSSRASNQKTLYSPQLHNQRIAEHLDLGVVHQRCLSFRPLADLVWSGQGNCPESSS